MENLPRKILKTYWGYDEFRPLQEDIISSVLGGNDTLALLPTGGGKSICFQVPALVMGGLCLVISPLIALMKDQVEQLKKRGIKAAAIYSGMPYETIEGVIENCLFNKDYNFLYISPERLQTSLLLTNLPRMNVSIIAVDEAHCISQWGYDFRPPYLEIAKIRVFFPNAPVLALTATATPEVVKDIQTRLQFKKENVFQKSFKRDNLTYFVLKEDNKMNRMLRILKRYQGSGIVYVRNRRKTVEIAAYLRQFGFGAEAYHAGFDTAERDFKQQNWMTGKMPVMVATNAFGMGIDKPDVRWVIHLDIPDSLEAYFQEAGRGGRDLLPSIAILLYDNNDIQELKNNFELSYPTIDIIKEVYKEVCNHYQIALGEGENKSYLFSAELLCKKLKIKPALLFNALSFLEKMGILLLSSDIKKQSALHFKMEGKDLEDFYQRKPEQKEFIQMLLRFYGGLFTNYVKISEEKIAGRAELTIDEIKERLSALANSGVLDYQIQSDQPHILFLQNRVNETYLYFDKTIYRDRKKAAEERLEAVMSYVSSTNYCRSQLLLKYFGEIKSVSCGTCDVCLNHHRTAMNKKEYDAIVTAIRKHAHLSVKEIIHQLSDEFPEKKVIEIVREMIDWGEMEGEKEK